jgi:hypothetical protein
MGWS